MLNGAVTLGTEDGANVEIHELVGDNNIYIFGDDSEAVIKRYADWSYCARNYYENDADIRAAIDFRAYVEAKERAYAEYENRIVWAKKMLMNISKAGYFSSDRTIEEYNRDIWHLER